MWLIKNGCGHSKLSPAHLLSLAIPSIPFYTSALPPPPPNQNLILTPMLWHSWPPGPPCLWLVTSGWSYMYLDLVSEKFEKLSVCDLFEWSLV